MALTFGTLLSSQGADAHHRNRFRLVRGNPIYATPVGRSGQIDRSPPGFPLGRRTPTMIGGASRLGEFGRLPLGLRSPNKENISQPDRAESNRPCDGTKSPDLLGSTVLRKHVDHAFDRVRCL